MNTYKLTIDNELTQKRLVCIAVGETWRDALEAARRDLNLTDDWKWVRCTLVKP